jgi:exonuclease-1
MNQALKAENVDYVVAPYEADAQMAFMEREGLVDGIITEDSDMLVFGCRSVRNWKYAFWHALT